MQGNDASERSKEKGYNKVYYTANIQKIADKKKVDYQEGLEKNHADSTAWSHGSEGGGLDGEIMTAHLTIVILLIIITK